MEYQRIIYLWDNTPNQLSKFKKRNWVEINNQSQGTYNKDNQIRFKTSMLKSSLCDYSDVYVLIKRTITVIYFFFYKQFNFLIRPKIV